MQAWPQKGTKGAKEKHTTVADCFLRRSRLFAVLERMADKLTEIMAWKRQEIAPRLRPVSEAELVRAHRDVPAGPSFAGALRRADGQLAVISEIKRRSPSAGEIKAGASAVDQAKRYQAAGADALSVLTDEKYFGGTLDDLRSVTAHFRANA